MVRKSPLPQSRHHLMIYDEDWEFLLRCYGAGTSKPIGPGGVIKTLIHHHVGNIRRRVEEVIDGDSLVLEKEVL